MSYIERFESAFSMVEIELACSLPICNTNDEVLFFYSTLPNDDTSFVFESICHVFRRDIKTGEIVDVTSSILNTIKADNYRGSIIRAHLLDEEAYDMEEMYDKTYEEYYRIMVNKVYDVSFSNICSRLISCFYSLVPDSPLRTFYTQMGCDYFTILQKGIPF